MQIITLQSHCIHASTAYHRVAGASGQPNDIGNGIILKYHYHCVPVIANFCDRLCNSVSVYFLIKLFKSHKNL
ncbi:hypothetical protein [Nostoc sp. DSM 114160]